MYFTELQLYLSFKEKIPIIRQKKIMITHMYSENQKNVEQEDDFIDTDYGFKQLIYMRHNNCMT